VTVKTSIESSEKTDQRIRAEREETSKQKWENEEVDQQTNPFQENKKRNRKLMNQVFQVSPSKRENNSSQTDRKINLPRNLLQH
jgi:hypothetical protein